MLPGSINDNNNRGMTCRFSLICFVCTQIMSTVGLDCPADTYSNSVASICVNCPFGAASPALSLAITNCTCVTGFTGPAGGPCELTNVQRCPSGRYEASSLGAGAPTARMNCSGRCCVQSSGASTSGIISDGTGTYRNNDFCRWSIISTDSTVAISLVFSYLQLETGYWDFVNIWSCAFNTQWNSLSTCTDTTSGTKIGILRSSFRTPTLYTSNTSVLYVELTSDNSFNFNGFEAQWTVCSACPINSNSINSKKTITDCVCNAGYTGLAGRACSQCAV